MAQNTGRKQLYIPPEGAIRRSQIVTTFGPGAMVDLVDQAVLIGGLDFWNFHKKRYGYQVLVEPRLRDALSERMRNAGRGDLSVEEAFREPPECDESIPNRAAGVQALEFPQWFVCQQKACRALVRARDGLERKGGRYVHACADGKRGDCVPVRFVGACKRGHLEDWPWVSFAHHGERCHAPDLRLDEGSTGDFSEIQIRCHTCSKFAQLSTALAEKAKPTCSGQRPWLGAEGRQECEGERLRLLVRTATNSYFSQVVSALSIPTESSRVLADAVAGVWETISAVAANPGLLAAFRHIPKVQEALGPFTDADVVAAIKARASGVTPERDPLRTAEYRQFIDAPPESPGDRPQRGDPFFVRRLRPGPEGLPAGIARVVLAHTLREVRAQIGFTRIEGLTPDLQGEYDIGVTSASLGLQTNWLPATEVLGEGVFIELDAKAVFDWERQRPVLQREKALKSGFDEWVKRLEPDHRPQFPGARFYLLHSLSHLLITAISLECGYAASAIRERIYCAPHDDPRMRMAGILLSTGTPGTEGTLGGLVQQGRFLHDHLSGVHDLAALCSNDPVCASHSPERDHAERHLEGAACHGCLFIAECSCERFNQYLDRALVVPTLGNDPAMAFFAARPIR